MNKQIHYYEICSKKLGIVTHAFGFITALDAKKRFSDIYTYKANFTVYGVSYDADKNVAKRIIKFNKENEPKWLKKPQRTIPWKILC